MLIRLPIALLLGWPSYVLVAAATMYDGWVFFVIQPIFGVVLTVPALAITIVVGAPLYRKSLWSRWSWAGARTLLISAFGLALMLASFHTERPVPVDDPTSGDAHQLEDALMVAGWLLLLFGVVHCPRIGTSVDRRWT